MAHMNRSSLAGLFHRHTLGIDGDRGAGGSGRLLRRSLPSSADFFDQRFDRYIGGGKGTLSLQTGLQAVSQIQPMLPRSRGQRAERADDALTGPLGGVVRLDEEEVGVGFALVSLAGFSEIHRTLQISHSFVTIYDFQLAFIETRRVVCLKSEKLTSDRGSRAKSARVACISLIPFTRLCIENYAQLRSAKHWPAPAEISPDAKRCCAIV